MLAWPACLQPHYIALQFTCSENLLLFLLSDGSNLLILGFTIVTAMWNQTANVLQGFDQSVLRDFLLQRRYGGKYGTKIWERLELLDMDKEPQQPAYRESRFEPQNKQISLSIDLIYTMWRHSNCYREIVLPKQSQVRTS